VLPEWAAHLPSWLVAGLALGALASLAVAGVFVVGDRLFPTAPTSRSSHVDGTARRRTEIRAYLHAIEEPYREDWTVGEETVAFYLPAHDVAITFDAHAYFRLERAGTEAVLCEHEMPGSHLGRRLPFETPAVSLEATPTSSRVAEAFATLGVPADASVAEVKAAYRSRVKEVHPDHGGDPRTFRELREAYAIARSRAEGAAS
jgi:hypothetical protein